MHECDTHPEPIANRAVVATFFVHLNESFHFPGTPSARARGNSANQYGAANMDGPC
jgi:hypothetical protein